MQSLFDGHYQGLMMPLGLLSYLHYCLSFVIKFWKQQIRSSVEERLNETIQFIYLQWILFWNQRYQNLLLNRTLFSVQSIFWNNLLRLSGMSMAIWLEPHFIPRKKEKMLRHITKRIYTEQLITICQSWLYMSSDRW